MYLIPYLGMDIMKIYMSEPNSFGLHLDFLDHILQILKYETTVQSTKAHFTQSH